MSSIILITILILFLIKIVRDSLYFVWLWQVKEYRMDRMKSYLKEEGAGSIVLPYRGTGQALGPWSQNARRKILQNANAKRLHRAIATMEPAAVYFIGLVLILISYFNQSVFVFFVLIFFAFTFYQITKEIKKRTLKRPKITFRILATLLATGIFYLYLINAFYWISVSIGMTRPSVLLLLLLFLYLITPILITIIILFTNPFFNFQKKRIIKKASLKMKRLKKIKVIGITGSYGKTSTKEFLYSILSQKYKVVKTEGNNNTNIGMAYTVLNKVSDDYDYFICEMGAYKIGEIKEMRGIVNPEIGILTGINEQHIDLFGSQENIIKAKFELIEALPEDGMAVINSRIRNQESRIKNIKYFSINDVENIKVNQDYVEFNYNTSQKCHSEFSSESIDDFGLVNLNSSKQTLDNIEKFYDNKSKILKQVQDDKDGNLVKFKINLLGKHYIENVLSAIIVAEHLGMDLEEIKNAIEKIKPTEYMMKKLDGPNNSIFIDDSYSANPDGVIAALDYLDEAYKDYQKIIVFPGIIELGNKSEEVHKKLFGRIGKVCDMAYILNQDVKRLHSPKGTMEPANECEFVFEKDFGKTAEMLEKNLNENTVVLFESRGAGVVMEKMKITVGSIIHD